MFISTTEMISSIVSLLTFSKALSCNSSVNNMDGNEYSSLYGVDEILEKWQHCQVIQFAKCFRSDVKNTVVL